MYAEKQSKKRITVSLLLALVLHGVVFLLFQYLIPVWTFELPEYSGPLVVTIEQEKRPIRREMKQEIVEERQEQPETAAPLEEQLAVQPAQQAVPQKPKPARQSVDSNVLVKSPATSSSRGIIGPEIIEESIPAPVEEEGVMPPIPGRSFQEDEKSNIPFTPKSEVESQALAFDVGHLDDAIEKKQEGAAQQAETQGTSESVPLSTAQAPSSRKPLIEWDSSARSRTLTYAGPSPAIPSWVKQEGLDLKVLVSFAVTPEGHTTSVKIRISSGYTDVDTAILDAVRKMKFNPDRKNELVTGTITYIISPK